MADPRFYPPHSSLDAGSLRAVSCVVETKGHLKHPISNAAELNDYHAPTGSIGFIKESRYLNTLHNTTLSAVIVPARIAEAVPSDCFAIISDQPRISFANILQTLYPQAFDTVTEDSSADTIDPSAKIAAGVRLGRGVVVGANAQISTGTQIGDYTVIGQYVQLGRDCRIGRHNTIRYARIGDEFWCDDHNAIGCAGFAFEHTAKGYVSVAQVGLLRIGRGVHLSSGCSIDRGALGDTVIGDQVQIESLCKIGHNVEIGARTVIVGLCAIAGSAIIGRGVQIAGKSGVKGFTTIGDGAKIMAHSAITKDVAEGAMMFGVPAMPYREFGARAHELHKLVQRTKRKKIR
ncbi:MAG: UDP-3-O-(3-hydroxymyristoyl)glucosamine N-acyltransferase [Alphaproteobacteria bacterium]|nr:UDP-3-O-(3-hydroxymyristoyl)glucosamine N-acyltransferase [Alphaproteobacteria bacterium]